MRPDKIYCALDLLGPCNYCCDYCMHSKMTKYPKPILHNLDRLAEIFDTLAKASDVVMTNLHARATEPAIHPQIVDVLNIASEVGDVRIVTNLSASTKDWMPACPENVIISASLHPKGYADLEGFTRRLVEVRDFGMRVDVTFLSHPSQAHLADRFRVHFEDRGFKFELASLKKKGIPIRNPPEPVEGTICTAGWQYIYVDPNTILRRCTIKRIEPMPSILSEPAFCAREGCGHRRLP